MPPSIATEPDLTEIEDSLTDIEESDTESQNVVTARALTARALIAHPSAASVHLFQDRIVCVCGAQVRDSERITLLGEWAKHRKICRGPREQGQAGPNEVSATGAQPGPSRQSDVPEKSEDAGTAAAAPSPVSAGRFHAGKKRAHSDVEEESDDGARDVEVKGQYSDCSSLTEPSDDDQSDEEEEDEASDGDEPESEEETYPATRTSWCTGRTNPVSGMPQLGGRRR